MQIHEDHEKYLKELKDRIANIPDPHIGRLEISNYLVMSSAAGWYIGSVCFEYEKLKDNTFMWIFQPWDRQTDYMTKGAAMEWWEFEYKPDIEEKQN